MTPFDALYVLQEAARRSLVSWELRVGPRDGGLGYTVAVRFRRRRQDGTVGRRWGRVLYAGPFSHPETALLRAGDDVAGSFAAELVLDVEARP